MAGATLAAMVLPISLGTSDFLQLRLDKGLYVDKSLFVAEILRDFSRVVLLPRPRRFGKTLNLSTLRYFVERPTDGGASQADVRRVFSGLQVEKSGEDVWERFQKHPVIFLAGADPVVELAAVFDRKSVRVARGA
jgi:hypothetical protein